VSLDLGESARHLLELAGDPIVPAQRFRPQDRFIAREDGRVHDPIGERLLGEHAQRAGPDCGISLPFAAAFKYSQITRLS
jgi:hypothetical protein